LLLVIIWAKDSVEQYGGYTIKVTCLMKVIRTLFLICCVFNLKIIEMGIKTNIQDILVLLSFLLYYIQMKLTFKQLVDKNDVNINNKVRMYQFWLNVSSVGFIIFIILKCLL